MRPLFLVSMLVLGGVTAIPSASAQQAPLTLEKLFEDFERADDSRSCIRTRYIRESTGVEDTHLLLEITSFISYLSELPSSCEDVDNSSTIVYNAPGGYVCEKQYFYVTDSSGRRQACQFGTFEKLTRKKKDTPDASGD